MILELSCPSKTFLLGEYLVLNNGPALLINTEPRFVTRVAVKGKGTVQGLHPDSPAGQWVRQNRMFFESVDFEFRDVHLGRGGFGASSAQFLMAYVATSWLKNQSSKDSYPIEQIWRAYRQIEAISSEGLRPSGADIVAQYHGGFCEFATEPFQARSYQWPLQEYDVVLAHTGTKMSTHEHLRGLKRVHTEELEWTYARAMETLASRDAQGFFDSVNDYHAELLELGLVCESTQVSVATLLRQPFVRAAKGCGAMGSDVIAVFVAKEVRPLLDAFLVELGLKYVSDSNNMSRGLLVEIVEDESVKDEVKTQAKEEWT